MRILKKKIISLIIITAMLCICFGCAKKEETVLEEVVLEETKEETKKENVSEEKMLVHVCGAVNNPGVYELPEDSRICDAIEAAGGMSKDAQESALNQAELLEDGMQVYVPKNEEEGLPASTGATSGKVNINTADKEELMSLSGIGESRAESILEYRNTHKRFRKIEELKEVDGIKDGIYDRIKDDICI